MPPAPKKYLVHLDAYKPGESKINGQSQVFKMSSNENPLGPSREAVRAFKDSARGLEVYPDGASTALRKALATGMRVKADNIVCTSGSDDIFSQLAQIYLNQGDEAIHTAHGFLMYSLVTKAHGGRAIRVAENNRPVGIAADIESIARAVTSRTRIVFLANPANPTGAMLSRETLQRLHKALPARVLLVLDGAYAEYVTEPAYSRGLFLVKQHRNVIVTGTFSKIYALAGLRLGWAYCPPAIAQMLHKVRMPFNVSTPAQNAGIAALKDKAHLNRAIAYNKKWRDWLVLNLRKADTTVDKSVANFFLMHFAPKGHKTAAKADIMLRSQGIIVREHEALWLTKCSAGFCGKPQGQSRAC